ncbi:MAG: hypothetical protein KY469_09685 [Actinobacteria bacterium]|nr:hypothetical protein [Actinomycetota bacterium]
MDEPSDPSTEHPGPLDVETPLRSAREHAVKALAALVIASASVFFLLDAYGAGVGWPEGDYRVEGEVVSRLRTSGGVAVFFVGRGQGTEVRWQRSGDADHRWEVGDTQEGWVVNGRFHADFLPTVSGPADAFYFLLTAVFVAWGSRRLFGIAIAIADARRTGDPPRHGYVAFVRNPVHGAIREVLLIWWADPTSTKPLPEPDLTLLADEEVGAELIGSRGPRIWEAWVDTGHHRWSKPRWISVREGVFIPHRRAILGGPALRNARKQEPVGPLPLATTEAPVNLAERGGRRHRFVPMLLGRLVLAAGIAAVSGLSVGSGERLL